MHSVLSYPQRGHYGKSQWRGNTSGYLIRDLIEHFKPKLFVDACEGSGTSGDVCKEMGIEYVGLDLYKGQDFTKDAILDKLPREADICFTHPPYHSMIQYSGGFSDLCIFLRTGREMAYRTDLFLFDHSIFTHCDHGTCTLRRERCLQYKEQFTEIPSFGQEK